MWYRMECASGGRGARHTLAAAAADAAAAAQPSAAMIKMICCLRRLPHLTPEQFQDYWLNRHGPLVLRHAAVMNVRRYVQIHTAEDPLNGAIQKSRGAPEPYDGVAELWFDSVASLTAPNGTPEGRAAMRAIREDERNFIDQARSPMFVGADHELIAG
jgi:uncharacterized protein (TIGR02118 family)